MSNEQFPQAPLNPEDAGEQPEQPKYAPDAGVWGAKIDNDEVLPAQWAYTRKQLEGDWSASGTDSGETPLEEGEKNPFNPEQPDLTGDE